jgi:hypothetical protein
VTLESLGISALGLNAHPNPDGSLTCINGARFGQSWRPTFDVILSSSDHASTR